MYNGFTFSICTLSRFVHIYKYYKTSKSLAPSTHLVHRCFLSTCPYTTCTFTSFFWENCHEQTLLSKEIVYTTLLNFLIFITGSCRGYPLVLLIKLNAYIGFFHAHIFLSALFDVHMYTYLMYIPPTKNLPQI